MLYIPKQHTVHVIIALIILLIIKNNGNNTNNKPPCLTGDDLIYVCLNRCVNNNKPKRFSRSMHCSPRD